MQSTKDHSDVTDKPNTDALIKTLIEQRKAQQEVEQSAAQSAADKKRDKDARTKKANEDWVKARIFLNDTIKSFNDRLKAAEIAFAVNPINGDGPEGVLHQHRIHFLGTSKNVNTGYAVKLFVRDDGLTKALVTSHQDAKALWSFSSDTDALSPEAFDEILATLLQMATTKK